MKLCDIFSRTVITAQPNDTLAFVARQMQEHNVGTVIIVEEMRPVGIVTDRDLALALGAQGVSVNELAERIMTRHVLAVPEDTGIFTATKYIRDAGIRRLPIVDRNDRLVGIVTLDDLLRCLSKEFVNLVEGIEYEMNVA